MPKHRSGIEVSQALLDSLSGDRHSVEWQRIECPQHIGMRDRQWWMIPLRINGNRLPEEQLVYYILTKYTDDAGVEREGFVVEDATKYADAGRKHYSMSETRTTFAESKEEAESRVVNILREFYTKP